MRKKHPIIIADENGIVLFSCPMRSCESGQDLFSGVPSVETKHVLDRELRTYGADYFVIDKNGKALVVCMNLFPSTRALMAFKTEINIDTAHRIISECGLGFEISDKRSEERKIGTRELEKAYETLSDILRVADSLQPFRGAKDFSVTPAELGKKVGIVSEIVGCDVELSAKDGFLGFYNSFDQGLFYLFMLSFLSMAFEKSPDRKAEVSFFNLNSMPLACISFEEMDFNYSSKHLDSNSTALYGNAAIRYCRAVAERLNLLFDIRRENGFSVYFSPVREDLSLLGLKSRPKLG